MSEFLEQLEIKIDVLEESERKKIIKEYQKKIESYIKDGKTEEEAIELLGNIDDIASDICASYHVNLNSRKKTLKEKINNGINISAKFLAETTETIIDYSKVHTKDNFWVTFFEILLKIIILIMIFMLLKIPVLLLQMGLNLVFDLLFYPFNITLANIFDYVLSIIYLALCIASSVWMFKGYFEKEFTKKEKAEIEVKEDKPENKKDDKKKFNYAVFIIKILIMIIIIIPLIFLNLAFLALTALAIFLIYKGVAIVGLAIILLSFFLLTLLMTVYLTDAIDNKNRNHLFSLSISIISLIIGVVLFADDLMKYDYPETLKDSHFRTTIETVTLEVNEETSLYFVQGDVEYITDESITDNNVLVEITYYDDFADIVYRQYINEDSKTIIFKSTKDNLNTSDYVYMYETILKDLKDNNLFKYSTLDNYIVKVYCNEATMELLKGVSQPN